MGGQMPLENPASVFHLCLTSSSPSLPCPSLHVFPPLLPPPAPKRPAGAVAVMVGMGGVGGAAPLLPANGTTKAGTVRLHVCQEFEGGGGGGVWTPSPGYVPDRSPLVGPGCNGSLRTWVATGPGIGSGLVLVAL